jgi:hypothetical protein
VFSIKKKKQAEQRRRIHAWKVQNGLYYHGASVRTYLLQQSAFPVGDQNANVHKQRGLWFCHWSNMEDIMKWQHWPLLVPTAHLSAETIDNLGHELDKIDEYIWSSTDFHGGMCFLINNRGQVIEEGSVRFVWIFTPNQSHREGGYDRWNGFPLKNHPCVANAKACLEPSLVLRVVFRDEELAHAEMTVVWMFGQAVNINADANGWEISQEGVTHRDYPHLGAY